MHAVYFVQMNFNNVKLFRMEKKMYKEYALTFFFLLIYIQYICNINHTQHINLMKNIQLGLVKHWRTDTFKGYLSV